jgi:acyl carrier protein
VGTLRLTGAESQTALRMGGVPAWDSLGHMQLVLELEKEFGVAFPTYALADLTDVSAIVREIQALQPA